MNDKNQEMEAVEAAVAADYQRRADALAATVNCIYHSHRQGVILCDHPLIGIYDNNGGYPNRERFWRALRQSLIGPRFTVHAEGSYRDDGAEDDAGAPYTRTMLVRCRYPGRRLITREDQVGTSQWLRRTIIAVKGTHRLNDGHDVVLLVPQDRRQDEIDAAIQKGLESGSIPRN